MNAPLLFPPLNNLVMQAIAILAVWREVPPQGSLTV